MHMVSKSRNIFNGGTLVLLFHNALEHLFVDWLALKSNWTDKHRNTFALF